MIGIRPHRRAPVPVPCVNCGVVFRAAYTGGRCPVCDTAVDSDAASGRPAGRVATLIMDRWTVALFALVIVGNVVIAILVARAVG